MKDKNLIFVHYPPGSGGWFLCSLIHFFHHPLSGIKFDQVGSGHANLHVRQVNDMYSCGLLSELGKEIIHGNTDNFSQDKKIEYLQNFNHPFNFDNLVLSLHTVNLDLFLQAFPQSKFITISISLDEIIKCRFNVLYKRFKNSPQLFEGLANQYGKNYQEEWIKLQRLNYTDLENFSWIDNEIHKFGNSSDRKDHRIYDISYNDLLTKDSEVFLDNLLEFFDLWPQEHEYFYAVNALEHYRQIQPKLPT